MNCRHFGKQSSERECVRGSEVLSALRAAVSNLFNLISFNANPRIYFYFTEILNLVG